MLLDIFATRKHANELKKPFDCLKFLRLYKFSGLIPQMNDALVAAEEIDTASDSTISSEHNVASQVG